jgi:cyclophilin family peptidyl-prolyl cis-trans isomerase
MKTLMILAAAAAVTPAPKPAPAPSEIVAAAPKGDWVAIPASDLLVMDLASGKRVVIQLMPPPFSQGWVGNIRKLAAARFWDGTSINRVQDNYVVQWGDSTEKKVLPKGLVTVLESQYILKEPSGLGTYTWGGAGRDLNKQEVQISTYDSANPSPKYSDAFADNYGFVGGLPVAVVLGGDPPPPYPPRVHPVAAWPVHCYGMVGVGRDMPPDTGTGAELYTVIGHAPRHLDRNIALVGRVISGIEHLSSLPRGTGPLGFYEKPAERTGIMSIRIGTEVKDLARFEYLSTESASFAAYANARANRRDAFFIRPAGGADICNIPVPVRVAK